MKYTFSDEEADSDAIQTRRSVRHSGTSTPAESAGPTFTASGRQIKSRIGGTYGESTLTGQRGDSLLPTDEGSKGEHHGEEEHLRNSRPHRSGLRNGVLRKARSTYGSYGSYDGADEDSDARSSGEEWNGGGDEDDDDVEEDQIAEDDDEEDVDMSEDDIGVAEVSDQDGDPQQGRGSLVVSLRYQPKPSQGPDGRMIDLQSVSSNKISEQPPVNNVIPAQKAQPQADFLISTNGTLSGQDQERKEERHMGITKETVPAGEDVAKGMDHAFHDWPMADAAPI